MLCFQKYYCEFTEYTIKSEFKNLKNFQQTVKSNHFVTCKQKHYDESVKWTPNRDQV